MSTLPVIRERLQLRQGKFNTPVVLPSKENSAIIFPSNSATDPDKLLTKKQKLAVEFLISGQAKTQYAAALMAGYKESVARCAWNEVFSKPNVRKEYNRRKKMLFDDDELTTQDIINDLRRKAEANPADYIEILPDGSFKFNLKNISYEQMAVIKEIGYDALGRPKLVLHDSRACMMDIAKLKGIGTENSNLTGSIDGPLTIASLDALIAKARTQTTNNIQINISGDQRQDNEFDRFLQPRQAKIVDAEVIEQNV